jgi:Glycosyl hydrolase 36 superfamily, catalytic domain/Glycosyltransferase family 36
MESRRTPFLEAADAPDMSRSQRWMRWLLRQRPLNTASFAAQAADDPRVFQPTEEGSGNFGRWILDENGLPAYQYEIDQHANPIAAYSNSEKLDRRDHWHQIGNHRITGLASNDGTIQVYQGDRGGIFLNRFEAWTYFRPGSKLVLLLTRIARAVIQFAIKLLQPRSLIKPLTFAQAQAAPERDHPRGAVTPEVLAKINQPAAFSAQSAQAAPKSRTSIPYAYAGGFGYLDDGTRTWATAYRYRPMLSQTRRVFGIGYFETETVYENVRVTRRVYAPYGDIPALLADVRIENIGAQAIDLRHYEYWDVHIQQLQLEWVRSGLFGASNDDMRRTINTRFNSFIEWEEYATALRFRQEPKESPSATLDDSSDLDWYPSHVFLADLSGQPNGVYVDKSRFFGSGGAYQPDAVRQHRPGDTVDKLVANTACCLVLRHDLHLETGEKRDLRFAYGSVRPEATLQFLDAFRLPIQSLPETIDNWKANLAYFSTRQDAVLQREIAWHSYYLLSATVYNAYHRTHIVPQGSAYLYLHGADGAPRDQALFTLPMSYLDAELARDMLRLIMRVTDAKTGQINYAFAGHGFVSDGLGIHTKPSDLDLFFLLAICEYLSATGDMAFLDEEVPFYPPSQSPLGVNGITVLDHIRAAVKHIFEGIGIGGNELIKVGSGDWSDAIVLETALRDGPGPFGVTYSNSKEHGESVPNTQMALYILPLLAKIIEPYDPQLVAYIYDKPSQPDRLERLSAAVSRQWNAKGWYNRAVLRGFSNNEIPIDHFSLEAQVWALISGLAAETDIEAPLIEKIDQFLDRPSPIGASLVEGGMVWPAVSQLMTWAYARCNRSELAWRSLNRNTFAMHSHVYPNVWFNTWSGPDGINGVASDAPGGTWASPITPMTDFPVMNANQDALALLGLLRVCGIEPAPTGDGLLIHPHVPREHFVLDLPLLRLEVAPGKIAGEYRAAVSGSRTFYIRVPDNAANISASINGQPMNSPQPQQNQIALLLTFNKGQKIAFEARWNL